MKPAVRTGALPGSTTACWPLVSSSVACSLPNRTLPSITDIVASSVSFPGSTARTNSVPSTPATAPRVMTRMRPGSSRWKNEMMPRSKCSPHCASDGIGRQHFNFRQSAKRHHAPIRPKERNPAVGAGAQPVERTQDLVGLCRGPGRGCGGSNLRRALKLHNPDFVRDSAGRLPTARRPSRRTVKKPPKIASHQQAAPGFKKQVQAF